MLKQVGERRNKLSTLVSFSMTALDMAPHVVKRSQSMRSLGAGPPSGKQHSGKLHGPADMILPHEYLYDLYAVCNHHGGMHGGHYTGKEKVVIYYKMTLLKSADGCYNCYITELVLKELIFCSNSFD